jgi:hypothetical protein
MSGTCVCAVTDVESKPWWVVRLAREFLITSVDIDQGGNSCKLLQPMIVKICHNRCVLQCHSKYTLEVSSQECLTAQPTRIAGLACPDYAHAPIR